MYVGLFLLDMDPWIRSTATTSQGISEENDDAGAGGMYGNFAF